MTIFKSLTYSNSYFNEYSIIVLKGNEVLIPFIHSSLFKIGVCAFDSLETCS